MPLPIDVQVKDSTSIIFGTFISKSYKKLPTGEVVTVASVKVKKSIGLEYKDLLNQNQFNVIYPGGVWQNINYHVHGAPEFEPGEEVVLLLAKNRYGHAVLNLSMGKYTIQKIDDEETLVSSLMPEHEYGKMKLKDFEKLAFDRFGETFQEKRERNVVHIHKPKIKKKITKKSVGRSIASVEGEEPGEVDLDVSKDRSFALFFFLFFIVIIGVYYLKSLGKRR